MVNFSVSKYIYISNFIFEIKNIYIDPNHHVNYQIALKNVSGEETKPFFFVSDYFTKVADFRLFVFREGSYIFKGCLIDLQNIMEYELSNLPDNIYRIKSVKQIGYIQKEKIWMFGNSLIYKGKLYYADEDDVIRIPDTNLGYQLDSNFEIYSGIMPAISTEEIDQDKVITAFQQLIGQKDDYHGLLGIGFVGATIFSDVIFHKYRQFPLLFADGITKSGKTSYLNFLMNIFGLDVEGDNFTETSQNYFAKAMNNLSNIPYWCDEYDENKKIKESYLRGLYNRSQAGKGTKTGGEKLKVNTSCILSGETSPVSEGLLNRLLIIMFQNSKLRTKENVQAFHFLNSNKSKLSYLFYKTILSRNKQTEKELLAKIEYFKVAFLSKTHDEKISLIFAIITAGLWIMGYENSAFDEWILTYISTAKKELDKENQTNRFFEDIMSLIDREKLEREFFSLTPKGDKIRLYFKGCYDEVAREKRSYYKDSTIRKYLKGEPYFVRDGSSIMKEGEKWCLFFDFKTFPQELKHFFKNDYSVIEN